MKPAISKAALPFVLLPLLLLLVTMTSGCTFQRSEQCPVVVSQAQGIQVESFTPSFPNVPVGSDVIVQLAMQNVGTSEATNVKATLWASPGFELRTGVPQTVEVGTPLHEPELSICSAGDTYVASWTLKARCDPFESAVAAVIDYEYTSNGWATIPLISTKEVARSAGQVSAKGENHPSAGPIQIKIESIQTEPVILSNEVNTFDIRVNLKNVGTGQVGTAGDGVLGEVLLTLEGPCEFADPNNPLQVLMNEGVPVAPTDVSLETLLGGKIQLRGGRQDAIKVITLRYAEDDVDALIQDTCRVNVDASYAYREFTQVMQKMGITGTAEQIAACRAQQN